MICCCVVLDLASEFISCCIRHQLVICWRDRHAPWLLFPSIASHNVVTILSESILTLCWSESSLWSAHHISMWCKRPGDGDCLADDRSCFERFFCASQISLFGMVTCCIIVFIVLSLIQFFALYDSNKDFTYNYYCGFSWIVRFGDPVDQWSERFWAFYWASRGYAGLTAMSLSFREIPVNDLKKVVFCTYRVWLCILHSACHLQLCKSFP